MVKPNIFFSAVLLAFFTAGCSHRLLQPVSTFGDALPFQTDPQNKDVLLYRNPNLKVTSYAKFLIDPVKIYSNDSHDIKASDAALLAETFRKTLIDSLQDRYEIVSAAGPGILRIKTAILDIQPARVQLDEDKFLVLRLDTFLAHVSMQLECVDSVSQARVAALIHTLKEKKYLQEGTAVRMANIRDVFSEWTQSLRARLDAAKDKPSKAFEGIDPIEEKRLRLEEGE